MRTYAAFIVASRGTRFAMPFYQPYYGLEALQRAVKRGELDALVIYEKYRLLLVKERISK